MIIMMIITTKKRMLMTMIMIAPQLQRNRRRTEGISPKRAY